MKNRLKGPLEDNLSDEKKRLVNRLIQAWICLSDVFYATNNRKRAIRQILPWERRSQYKKNRLTGIFGRSGNCRGFGTDGNSWVLDLGQCELCEGVRKQAGQNITILCRSKDHSLLFICELHCWRNKFFLLCLLLLFDL